MKIKLIFFFASIINCVLAQEMSFPQVEIAGSHVRVLKSAIVDQEYNLYINLPRGYHDTSKKFPVVFVLDAQWDFTLITSLYGQQYYDGFVPAQIVVGITWGGKNPNPDSLRVRDFSPTHVGRIVQSGGGGKFLSFIQKELIPFLNKNYRVAESGRTLMGSSYGGLFTLYALFSGTNVFDKYILTSPYLGFDNSVINSFVEKYSEKNSTLAAKVFMAHGEMEGNVPGFEKFVESIKTKNLKGLEIKSMILEHMGHSGGKAEGYTRGLQYVFDRPSLNLSDTLLEQYVGTFQSTPERKVTVAKKDGHLILTGSDNSTIELFASSEKKFYATLMFFNIEFEKNERGNVEGFSLQQFNGNSVFKKVN